MSERSDNFCLTDKFVYHRGLFSPCFGTEREHFVRVFGDKCRYEKRNGCQNNDDKRNQRVYRKHKSERQKYRYNAREQL